MPAATSEDAEKFLDLLDRLSSLQQADHDEVLEFIEAHGLAGRGLGWVDVDLLASVHSASASLFTLDKRLAVAAKALGIFAS